MKYAIKWGQRLIIPILLGALIFSCVEIVHLSRENKCLASERDCVVQENIELQSTVTSLTEQLQTAFAPLQISVTEKHEIILLADETETNKSVSTVLLPSKEIMYPVESEAVASFNAAAYDEYGIVHLAEVNWSEVDDLINLAHINPCIYRHLFKTGQQLDRMYRGLTFELYPMSADYAAAAEVIYNGYCWDDALSYYAPGYTPWIGRGEWVVRKLLPYGLEWEFAMAALYAESSWGCNLTAVAFGNAATLDGYINLVLTYPAPNDIDRFVNEWHMPANIETFRFNFGNVVTWLRAWRP